MKRPRVIVFDHSQLGPQFPRRQFDGSMLRCSRLCSA
jgi:hypothetical protein